MKCKVDSNESLSRIDVMNNYDIVNATEIVVRGGSAGALGGVTSNMDWFNQVR